VLMPTSSDQVCGYGTSHASTSLTMFSRLW
jgi:hypothetical protein